MRQQRVDYKENLTIVLHSLKEIQNDISLLNNELSIADRKIQDMLHIIEKINANACEGYSLFKKLQDVQRERREIKERLQEASNIKDFMSAFKKGTESTLKNKIQHLEQIRTKEWTYEVKELKELEPYNDRIKSILNKKSNKNKK